MQTAITTNGTDLDFSWSDIRTADAALPLNSFIRPADAALPFNSFLIFMHFSELEVIKANESRKFRISLNGEIWYNHVVDPKYLETTTVPSSGPTEYDSLDFIISMAFGSTLPPILNAIEVYRIINIPELETNNGDVDAIRDIKEKYNVQRNWMGDPCAPRNFTWDGLNCSYSDSRNPRIISLNLASSGLIGEISDSLSKLTELQKLDLSGNELEGRIPDFFTSLSNLRYLNLSGNKLSGLVPKGILDRSTMGTLVFSVSDNPDLCVDDNACGKSESKSKRKYIVVIITSVCSATVILSIILLALRRLRRPTPKTSDPPSDPFQRESRQFTYEELVMVTDTFRTSIGRGGFGTVYHGVLENGIPVAVKMLSQSSSQGTKEFETEARLLTRIHHRNLVPLVGYCTDVNHLALVYEYMAEGSLANHILGNATNKNTFFWRERLRVATESAQGLEYLHKGCKPAIIHRDVKPSNILLNEKLEARIADFGLSKSFQNDIHSDVYTIVMGTPGYLDPEYSLTNMLNEKSDVYSFGVILLQLITGQHAIIHQEVDKIHITKWAQEKLERGDINEIIDKRLPDGYDINSVWKTIEIALSCTAQASIQRPTMTQVLMLLKDALEQDTMYEYATNNNSSNANNDETIKMMSENINAIMNPLVR